MNGNSEQNTGTGGEKNPELINSNSDERVENTPVRHQYRKLNEFEKADMADLKDLGQAFIDKCNHIGKSREMSIAVTKAEEAVMWAVKHITR